MIEHMTRKDVNYDVIYIGETYDDAEHGKTYKCIAEWYDSEGKFDSISMIDETGEDYIYDVSDFKKLQ